MDDTRAGRTAHGNRVAGQVRLGDGGEHAVFFMTDVDELDLTVAAQCVDDWVQGVANIP